MKPALCVHDDIPNTCVLEAPAGQEDSCAPLAIVRAGDCMISRWELTDEERRQIAEGGSVFLFVHGQGHPPVGLATELKVTSDA